MITVGKTRRSPTAVMPGWLIVICGVCLVIPLVRLAALLFTAGLCLIQPAKSAARLACGRAASRTAFDGEDGRVLHPGLRDV
jgi:hypothetical protein